MKDLKKDILSNILVKELINSKIIPTSIEPYLNKSHTFSDLVSYLNNAKEVFNYLVRYPKPILGKLISEKIISDRDFKEYKIIFDYYGVSLKCEPEEVSIGRYPPPEGFFKVWISSFNFDFAPLVTDIKNKFVTKTSESGNVVFVSSKQVNEFLEKYKDIEEIHWSFFCQETNIPWTNELITRFSDVWDWKRLHRNPSVKWNFELIEANLKYVNWLFISTCPSLKWTKERLIEYKEYLVFHSNKPNKKGDEYSLQENGFSSSKNVSLSSSKTIEWSLEIIDCVRDYWNWDELCSNESIPWDGEIIDYFEEQIHFGSLSSNPSVKWTEELIRKYRFKWDWEGLSGNPNLPWSYGFIKEYEDQWYWKPDFDDYFENEIVYPLSLINSPSISSNQAILWDEKMLLEWENRVDFWRIAKAGKIEESAIKKFHTKFYRKEVVNTELYKHSDWYDSADIYRTGWENFSINKNFFMTRKNIDFYYQNSISLTYPVGNLANDGFFETKDYRLLEILKNSLVLEISLNELIENEAGWSQYLVNDSFINDSIWVSVLKPIFTDELCRSYLEYHLNYIELSEKSETRAQH